MFGIPMSVFLILVLTFMLIIGSIYIPTVLYIYHSIYVSLSLHLSLLLTYAYLYHSSDYYVYYYTCEFSQSSCFS